MRASVASGSRVSMTIVTAKYEKIIPASAGADAIVVRDYADTVNRFKVSEDGKITFAGGTLKGDIVPDGDMTRSIGAYGYSLAYVLAKRLLNPYRSAGDYGIVFTDIATVQLMQGTIYLGTYGTTYLLKDFRAGDAVFGIYNHGAYGWLFRTSNSALNAALSRLYIKGGADVADVDLYNANLDLHAPLSSSTATLMDSLLLRFIGEYWDTVAGASKSRIAQIFHRMLSTTPSSELAIQIEGADYMRIGDRGVKLDKVVFDPGSSVSIDADATYTLPVGAWYVNLGANTVAEYYSDVDAAWLTVIPAGGKGLVISDGSNARLRNTGTVAESSTIRRVF